MIIIGVVVINIIVFVIIVLVFIQTSDIWGESFAYISLFWANFTCFLRKPFLSFDKCYVNNQIRQYYGVIEQS